MERVNVGSLIARVWGLIALCALGLLVGPPGALAQDDRPEFTPEKRAAAQEVEAKCVAKSLNLSEEVTGQLVTAYKAARKSHREAMEKIRESEEGDRASRFQQYLELNDSDRGKLESALKEFLTEDQVKKAIESLGTFAWRWDRYVDTLAGFELDEEKLYQALGLVNTYIVDISKAGSEARKNSDWEAWRTIRREHKEKLDTGLATVLSAEQLAQWTEATTRRRR